MLRTWRKPVSFLGGYLFERLCITPIATMPDIYCNLIFSEDK